jgi:predicted O-methyltransferase YrrM
VARLDGIVTIYYALMREVAPEIVVETGTAAGGYTALVLAALVENGRGRLVSIDIPPVAGRLTMDDLTLDESEVGFFVPAEYRERWEYRRGDAKVLLPRALLEQPVDVFIHDSLHTRTHMLLEYSLARALMDEGKLIVSDDILWNSAFESFLLAHGMQGFAPYANPNTGVCVNRFDDFERRAGLGVWKG